jgi:hypothetical protein
MCVCVTVRMRLLGQTVCVPLQLPSLEWLLLDAASCSGAASGPMTSRDGEQSAAAAAPTADLAPAATAAQVPQGPTAAKAAEVAIEEAAKGSPADAELQGTTAVSAKAADNSIAGASPATRLQSTSGRCADRPPVSITHRQQPVI